MTLLRAMVLAVVEPWARFLTCSYFGVCHVDGVATVSIQKCSGSIAHVGAHEFERPWVEGY